MRVETFALPVATKQRDDVLAKIARIRTDDFRLYAVQAVADVSLECIDRNTDLGSGTRPADRRTPAISGLMPFPCRIGHS